MYSHVFLPIGFGDQGTDGGIPYPGYRPGLSRVLVAGQSDWLDLLVDRQLLDPVVGTAFQGFERGATPDVQVVGLSASQRVFLFDR